MLRVLFALIGMSVALPSHSINSYAIHTPVSSVSSYSSSVHHPATLHTVPVVSHYAAAPAVVSHLSAGPAVVSHLAAAPLVSTHYAAAPVVSHLAAAPLAINHGLHARVLGAPLLTSKLLIR
ncbi:pupal cuticle protein G1A-like [Oppia nitens]|uniref:pupal cuticle protein G1A-like n=1 Tax=Oppia nitens TaxID=1686743 RepID=UPI0023DA4287|nr:pupal cuticle protein G1A-like [Oppia nitens]